MVAIEGRSIDRMRHIWGEIITQLERVDTGSVHWKDGPRPPSKKEWVSLVGEGPVLILLDELPPYLDYAAAVGSGEANLGKLAKYALSNLFAAALELPQCCIVVSSLSGTYSDASSDLHDLANEASRQARSLTPVDLATDEIYRILQRRLFEDLPSPTDIAGVTDAYRAVISQAITSQSLPSTSKQLPEEIPQTYPFHPSVKHVIALFRNNETFRQTRGLMQLASRMILSTWQRPSDDVYLIGCQHLNLEIQEVRDDLNRIRDLQAAVAHDIFDNGSSVAERIDAELGGDDARQISAMTLTGSLSSAVDAVQGFTRDQLIEYLISPNVGAREVSVAFDRLRGHGGAWYLHKNQSEAWYFSPAENLWKLIEDRAQNAPQPKIEAEMRRRLKPRGKGVYGRVEALPRINDVDLRGDRVCVVLEPERSQPTDTLKQFYQAATEKNNLCVVTGDGSKFADLEKAVRRAYGTALAREQMAHNQPDKVRDAEDLANEAEQAVNATIIGLFNKVIFPTREGLAVAPLSIVCGGRAGSRRGRYRRGFSRHRSTKIRARLRRRGRGPNHKSRRHAVALRGPPCALGRYRERARVNPRWKWMEPKGLVRLRERAKGQGRWRDHNDGWIEKGPFPKEKTTVTVLTEHYNDRTGEAHVAVRSSHAGKSPQVFYSSDPNVSASSGTLLPSEVLKTDATSLWFVAVDADGQHETGPAVPWKNQLTITHEVQTLPDGRRLVTLTVRPDISKRPGGVLKWNTQGINPKDGQRFEGEIIIDTPDEAKVWAYAAHEGVEQNRTFVIPAGGEGPPLIYDQPATLTKKWGVSETGAVFGVLKSSGDKGAKLTIKRDKSAGITEKLMQQRICSSFASGLATAKALLAKRPLPSRNPTPTTSSTRT